MEKLCIVINEDKVNAVMKKFSFERDAAVQFIVDGSYKLYSDTVEDFDYDESKHPRADDGKWTDKGSGGGSKGDKGKSGDGKGGGKRAGLLGEIQLSDFSPEERSKFTNMNSRKFLKHVVRDEVIADFMKSVRDEHKTQISKKNEDDFAKILRKRYPNLDHDPENRGPNHIFGTVYYSYLVPDFD